MRANRAVPCAPLLLIHGALAAWRESIKLKPNATVLSNIAAALADLQQTHEGIEAAKAALKLDPNNGDARQNLATLYRDTNQPARAKEQLEAAREANPNYGQARLLLGVLHLSGGEYDAAIRE